MHRVLFILLLSALPATATAQTLAIPVDVGVGPAGYFITGPMSDDQLMHTGLRFDVFAAIDRPTRMKYMKYIPKKYRKFAKGKGEFRIDPVPWYVPRSFFISPKVRNTGMYGLTWRPLGLGVRFGDLGVGLGALLTYAYIHSDTLPDTHFLRPGIDLKAEFEIPLARRRKYGLSIAWASQFYPPQELGGEVLKLGELDSSIWHVGQLSVLFHYRFDYHVSAAEIRRQIRGR